MLTYVIHYFYPDLKDESKKFSLLSFILFLIIGSYWLLRLLKNTIFLKIAFPQTLGWAVNQGCLFQPIAKFWSPFVVLTLVLIYSKLVDIFKKHQLFYIICSFYSIIFAATAGILCYKEIYGAQAVGCSLLAITGWISYFAVESFGSLTVALFWSFTNSITTADSAKQGFPLIVACAQFGAVIGSAILFFSHIIGSLWPILLGSSVLVASVIPLIYYFMRTIPKEQLIGNEKAAITEKKNDSFFWGFISGLTLLFSRPYLLGVLIVSTFYEAIAQIVEYQMQTLASISPEYGHEVAFARFQAMYGLGINILSLIIALLGTRYIIKHYGLRISLLIYPIFFGITLIALFGYFKLTAATQLLWVTFTAMVCIKGIGYAVNNPTKEMMYIPTSKDAKFKSKSWIDTFGSRFAKAGGAHINNMFKTSLSDLMIYGTLFGSSLISIWIFAAIYVGLKHNKLLKEQKIVE